MDDPLPYLDNQIEPLIGNHLDSLLRSIDLINEASDEMLQTLEGDITGHNMFLTLSARIYNHLLAGQLLFRKGLLTDAIGCLRNAVESIYLFVFLIQDKSRMEKWLSGTEYSPREVRKHSVRSELMKNVYGGFSKITHPNAGALKTYALIDRDAVGISFGPRIPKKATLFTFIQLLAASAMFLGTVVILLKAAKPEGMFDSYDKDLGDVEKIENDLQTELADIANDSEGNRS